MAKTTHATTLDPALEQEVLALWPTLSTQERTLWLRVFDTLLPQDATLRAALAIGEPDGPADSVGTEDDAVRSPQAAIERLALQGSPPPRPYRDWQATIGMFANDPIMDAILDAGRRIREAERTEEC